MPLCNLACNGSIGHSKPLHSSFIMHNLPVPFTEHTLPGLIHKLMNPLILTQLAADGQKVIIVVYFVIRNSNRSIKPKPVTGFEPIVASLQGSCLCHLGQTGTRGVVFMALPTLFSHSLPSVPLSSGRHLYRLYLYRRHDHL